MDYSSKICYNFDGDFMEISVFELLEKEIKDEVVVFQTDTVYGIGCLVSSKLGVKKIYDIKKRDGNNPLAVLCADLEQVKSVVQDFELCEALGRKFWPGALTLILPKKDVVGNHITSGFNTVGVRIPNDEIALKILSKFGPMAVTSLNLSSEPAILKYDEAVKYSGLVDYIVKGKNLDNLSSTVYDCINKKTLRKGEISID